MNRMIRLLSMLMLSTTLWAQNSRTDALFNDENTNLMNLNMEQAVETDGFQVVSTDYNPGVGYNDIVVSNFDFNGQPTGTYKIIGPDMEFFASGTCLSYTDGNIIIVGTAQLVDYAYPHHAFFLEYEVSTNSVVNFQLYKDTLDNMDITFLNVEQGYNNEYVVVGFIQTTGGGAGIVSLISGFNTSGILLWERQYVGPGGGHINAFESVDKATYVINGPPTGGTAVPYGSSYLVSGVGDNNFGEFMTCVGLFDYNNKSFWWYRALKTTYFHGEKGVQVIYDRPTDKVLLFSQHSGSHNFQVYRFDLNGNYIDHHSYFPNLLAYPGMILSSVEERDGNYWLNGYFSCPWGGTNCPPGVLIGYPFSIIVDRNLNLVEAIYFRVHDVVSSGASSFIFNGPPDYAIGLFFLGSDTWTPESQVVVGDQIYFAFGEQSESSESIDFFTMSSLNYNDLASVCADTFWVVEFSTTATPSWYDHTHTLLPVCDVTPISSQIMDTEEVFVEPYDCDSDLRRGNFVDELGQGEVYLTEIEVFDGTGKFLGKYKDRSEIISENHKGFLIIKESYSDGSSSTTKMVIQ